MIVYFAASTTKLSKHSARYTQIIDSIKSLGHEVSDSWLVEVLNGKHPEADLQQLLLRNTKQIQEADFLIVELSEASFGVGYCVGQAVAHRKKVLCLSPSEMDEGELSDIVRGSNSSLLVHNRYTVENMQEIIQNFIKTMKLDNLRKFNFLINDEIAQYVEEGAAKTGKSKSEFLRDVLTQEIIRQ